MDGLEKYRASFSLKSLEIEKTELQKDYFAFGTAYDTLRMRILQTTEDFPERGKMLEVWAGSWACLGSLELAKNSIEKKILEVGEIISKIRSGEIPNKDEFQPLGIVKGDYT